MMGQHCEMCGTWRQEITGNLCYPCRCKWQEREMVELRAEIERLKAKLAQSEKLHDERDAIERKRVIPN